MTPRPRLIAEIGSVHDGSFGNACNLISSAIAAGADAVKFQTHFATAESTAYAPNPSFFSRESRIHYFERTGFSLDQWRCLLKQTSDAGALFLSSAFSLEAVELLEEIGVEAHKVPSGEVTNLPLLERLAATGKPVYLSSGMSTWEELDVAVEILRAGGPLTVMQCTSLYPCPPEKVGLNLLATMQARYNVPIGYSDHTMGVAAAIAAVSLGAVVVEKHFTFSRQMYGSDAAHSMEPTELEQLAEALRQTQSILNRPVDKDKLAVELASTKLVFEKSIVARRALAEGHILELGDLAFKKPGDGISPARYPLVVGRRVKRTLATDEQLREEDLI